MLPFQPESDLVDARARTRRMVDRVLAKLQAGTMPDAVELEHVDIKEEAGRVKSRGVVCDGFEA